MNHTGAIQRSELLAAGLTAAMWGLTGVFVRLLPPLSPFTVAAGRLLIALAVALPALGVSGVNRFGLKGALTRPIAYALASLLAGYYLLATAAFQLAPVAEVALLISTSPLFVLAFGRIRGDIPARAEMVGAVLAIAGIALIMAPRLSFAGSVVNDHLIGDAFAIFAAALTALYAYLYRQLAKRNIAPEATSVTFMTFALGSIVLMGVLALPSISIAPAAFSGSSLIMFLGLGVLCTAIPSFAFAVLSKRLPSIVTSAISLLIPLFAGLFAYMILGEKSSSTAVPGGALVLAGVVMVLRQNSQAKAGRTSVGA